MALPGTACLQVQTDGSDSITGGGFDYAAGSKPTDLAATSATGTAPVVTSATYTFVAGDVGAWLVVVSGTNWRPGRYQISSVAAGAATINAASGQYYLVNGTCPTGLGNSDGCATAASPTGGTWAIDYSEQAAAQFAYTDLARATNTTLTSAAKPFQVAHVGNFLRITAGTNWTTGIYHITSVNSGTKVATVDRTCSAAGAGAGTGYQGGAFATPGWAGSIYVAGMDIFIKDGSYTQTSASANVAGGGLSLGSAGTAANPGLVTGYNGTYRYFGSRPTTRPVITLNLGLTGGAMLLMSQNHCGVCGVELDVNAKTNSLALTSSGSFQAVVFCKFSNGTATNWAGNISAGSTIIMDCEATGGTAACWGNAGTYLNCVAHDNTASGFVSTATTSRTTYINCIADTNTGASSDGFSCNTASALVAFVNCIAYNNGRHGFNVNSTVDQVIVNCIAEANGNTGFACGDSTTLFSGLSQFVRNAAYNNTTANWYSANFPRTSRTGFGATWSTEVTASPFISAGTRDWRLHPRGADPENYAALIQGYPLYPADQYFSLSFGGCNLGFTNRAEPALVLASQIGMDRGGVNG